MKILTTMPAIVPGVNDFDNKIILKNTQCVGLDFSTLFSPVFHLSNCVFVDCSFNAKAWVFGDKVTFQDTHVNYGRRQLEDWWTVNGVLPNGRYSLRSAVDYITTGVAYPDSFKWVREIAAEVLAIVSKNKYVGISTLPGAIDYRVFELMTRLGDDILERFERDQLVKKLASIIITLN